jgi:hypothetical protein
MPNQGRQSRDFLDRKGLDNQRSNATSTDSDFETLSRRRATNLIVASPFSFRSMNPSCCQAFKSALLRHPGYASGIPVLFARFQAGSNQCRRISAATSWSPQSSHDSLDSLAILIANQQLFFIELHHVDDLLHDSTRESLDLAPNPHLPPLLVCHCFSDMHLKVRHRRGNKLPHIQEGRPGWMRPVFVMLNNGSIRMLIRSHVHCKGHRILRARPSSEVWEVADIDRLEDQAIYGGWFC